MMTVCAECGKRIVVTWPEFYVYKRGKGEDTCYFCSENCMIVSDVRDTKERSGWNDEPWITEGELEAIQAGRKPFRMLRRPTSRNSRPPAEKDRPEKPAERTGQDMGNNKSSHKLTREEKEKAVELAIAGKDPLSYLRERGAQNPSAAWWYIKKTLAKSNPKLLEKIPEKLGTVLDEKGQAVPADDSPDGVARDPSTTVGMTANEEAEKDPLEGFVAYDPGAPDGDKAADLVINAEDLAAAEDPAVKRMEAFARMEKTDSVPPVAGRLVMDEHGLHTVQEKPEPKKDEAAGPEIMTFYGFPFEMTAMKVDEFEFAKVSEGMRVCLPGGSLLCGTALATPVIMDAEQWKRLAELIPKAMKALKIG